jgi:YD repeat-containing protein
MVGQTPRQLDSPTICSYPYLTEIVLSKFYIAALMLIVGSGLHFSCMAQGRESYISGIIFPGESEPNIVNIAGKRGDRAVLNNSYNHYIPPFSFYFNERNNISLSAKPGVNEPAGIQDNSVPTTCAEGSGNSNPTTAHPVIIATGEKYQLEEDLRTGSPYGLYLNRTYRSFDSQKSMFGANWRSSYDYTLTTTGCSHVSGYSVAQCVPDRVTLTFPDGSTAVYERYSDYKYRAYGSPRDGELSFAPYSGYTLYRNNLTYSYSIKGLLYQINRARAIWQTPMLKFDYDVYGKLSRVTNSVQQAIIFSWLNDRVNKVTDPAGQEWNYNYNANGMLASVTSPGTNPDIRTYQYEYPADSSLLTGISINGTRHSEYKYFSDKRVQESGLAGGEERETFAYGTNQTTVTDALGQPVTYTFGRVQRGLKLTAVSRASTLTCSASSASTVYDSNGWVDYTLDWNGVKTDYSYDAGGTLLQKTSSSETSAALAEIYTWSGRNLMSVLFRDANNTPFLRTDYTYFDSGFEAEKLSAVTTTDLMSGLSRRTTYAYSYQQNGVIQSETITESNGSTETTVFDAVGNVVMVKNALGHEINYANHNGLGLPGRAVDINGIATIYQYDEKGNLINASRSVNNGFQVTSFTYDHNRHLTDISHPDGRAEKLRYNAAGRLTQVGNALNEFIGSSFDVTTRSYRSNSSRMIPSASGSSLVGTASDGFSSTIQLDSLGRPYTQRGNHGQVIDSRFDNNGNLRKITDAEGRMREYTYDAKNRLMTYTAADGGQTVITYDAAGRLYSLRDPRGLTTTYTYNGFGDKISMNSPDSGNTSYTYDEIGQLKTENFADGRVATYTWDPLGRLVSKSVGGSISIYIYDEGVYGKGLLTRMQDHTGETMYTHGPNGELLQQTNHIFDQVFNTKWTYDNAGRKETMTYPSGMMLKYTYDAAGRVSAIKSNGIR